jgi:signal transduction histidine kinase
MWRPVNIEKGSDIRFNNLAPGEYKLKIRKRNGFGAGNYFISEYQFNITIPWYKKWWFNFIILLFISGMIMLFVRIRTNQLKQIQVKLERLVDEKTKELQEKNTVLEKNDSIKTRLISIISHDIVTPLKFLTAAGKNLMEKRKLMPEELQQETLNEMTNTSQELQLLSTNILNWIKYQNENRRLAKELFDVNEIVNQVFSVLYSLARQKKLNLVNDIPAGTMIYQYFEPLKILIYNLVSNAINFTEAGKITVRIKTNPDTVTISVKDDGVGMTTEQIKNIMADEFIISSANIDNRKGNGLGYLIIKDLLKTMEGQLHIESERVRPDDPVGRGKGTEVFITIPSGYTSRTGES